MYAITGITGNVGGNVANSLLAAGRSVRAVMRDVGKGTIQDKRVGATDDIEITNLDSRNVEYLYSDNEGHIVMDMETYDQTTIPKEVFGDDILYLKPNTQLTALFHEGKIVSYTLPASVDLEVVDTMPVIKGATATNQLKEAKLETGLMTRVPGFIVNGEKLKISTETGEYLSRA